MWVIVHLSSHGASALSTWRGAAHTQARQSCSQHSSRRLSDVCVWGGGGVCVREVGGERMAVMQSMLHWEDGRCVWGVGAVVQSTHTAQKQWHPTQWDSFSSVHPFVRPSIPLSVSLYLIRMHTHRHTYTCNHKHTIYTHKHTHTHTQGIRQSTQVNIK